MDDSTTQGAAAAFQAEDAEHVDERAEVHVPQGFQAEDGEHDPARLRGMPQAPFS